MVHRNTSQAIYSRTKFRKECAWKHSPLDHANVEVLPSGVHATGFMSYEYSMGGKRLELLSRLHRA